MLNLARNAFKFFYFQFIKYIHGIYSHTWREIRFIHNSLSFHRKHIYDSHAYNRTV